jgi:hypothetical protein
MTRFDTYLRSSAQTPIKSKATPKIKSDPNRSVKIDDDDVMEVDDDDSGFASAFSPLPKLSPAIKSSPVRFCEDALHFTDQQGLLGFFSSGLFRGKTGGFCSQRAMADFFGFLHNFGKFLVGENFG